MKTPSNSLTNQALLKLKKNKFGVLSFWFIIICGFIAVFAYILAPDNSINANQMHLELHTKPPLFKVKMLEIPTTENTHQNWFNAFFNGIQNPPTQIPISNYLVKNNCLEITLFKNKNIKGLQKKIPLNVFPNNTYKPYLKTKTFYLGTDKYGRDLLSRMLIGTRISFSIGFIAVLISLLIGISIGSIAGYFGGKIDTFAMWLINITWAIPTLLLVIAITLALGKGFYQVFIAVGLTMWVEVARVVRGQVLSVKEMQFVEAAKALGFSDFRIITKHILPNILAPVIVISAANFAGAILIESGLSFLGIGAQPPIPSWGAMIKDHYGYIILGKAYLAIIPGLAIMSLVLAFMLIGNALRDALEIKN